MKIFRVSNKGKTKRLIVAESENRAKEIAMTGQCARKIENLKTEDITAEYVNHHGPRGFDISKMSEGFFFQMVNGPKSTWDTYMI